MRKYYKDNLHGGDGGNIGFGIGKCAVLKN